MKFKEKGIVLILVIGICAIINPHFVIAGSLNGNENALINVARGEFEQGGVKYHVDEVFIQQLISYLSSDGVDLTAEQKDEAVSIIFSNVEQGINSGYLVANEPGETKEKEVEEPTSNSDSNNENNTSENNKEYNKKNHLENTSKESDTVNNIEKNMNKSNDEKVTGKNNETDTINSKDNFVEKNNEEGEMADVDSSSSDNAKVSSDNIITEIKKQPVAVTEVDKNSGKVIVKDENNSSLLTVDTVIKNTGFNLNRTVVFIIIMAGILITSILITIGKGYLQKIEDENGQ